MLLWSFIVSKRNTPFSNDVRLEETMEYCAGIGRRSVMTVKLSDASLPRKSPMPITVTVIAPKPVVSLYSSR